MPPRCFNPVFKTLDVRPTIGITVVDKVCRSEQRLGYICLKPVNEPNSEQIIQDLDVSAVNKETFWFGVSCAAFLMAVCFGCFAALFYKKNKRSEEKLKEFEGEKKVGRI